MPLSNLAIVGTIVAISSGVISYLLTQGDVAVPALLKVFLGAAQVGLTILSLRLNLNSNTTTVSVTTPKPDPTDPPA